MPDVIFFRDGISDGIVTNVIRSFEEFNLNDSRKQALIFVRELSAIDNITYCQLSDVDTLKASSDLRAL